MFDFKDYYTSNLPRHLTGIVGNISHLPQKYGGLTSGSCDMVYWHSSMMAHLREYEVTLREIVAATSMKQAKRMRHLSPEQQARAAEQLRREKTIETPEDEAEAASIQRSFIVNPKAFLQRMRNTDTNNSLRGIFQVLKSGGFFVETEPLDDIDTLMPAFASVGANFSEAHYVFPENREEIWVLVLKKV